MRMTMEESMKALSAGIDLHGVCLYPIVDIPDWHTGVWARIGMFDINNPHTTERLPCAPYIQELRRWQKLLAQPEHFNPEERHRGHVQISGIRDYAQEWAENTPDATFSRTQPLSPPSNGANN